jgi:hypothetical protein
MFSAEILAAMIMKLKPVMQATGLILQDCG